VQLVSDRLILRELAETDATRFLKIETAPGVGRYLTRLYHHPDEALEYIRGIMVEAQEVPRLAFDFAVTLNGEMIGRCGMKRDASQPADAMFWYVFDPAHHGQGYATEAARALLAYAFEELRLHRMWADVDPRNPASLRVCERLGLRKEAHHIENVFIRDEWCDTVIYAMLRREWPG
jgi:ribosomal-protein-alanine N-acetyltransferase